MRKIVAATEENKEEILKCIQELDSDTQLVVFPELCITGYTCQDLFYEHTLLNLSLIHISEPTRRS